MFGEEIFPAGCLPQSKPTIKAMNDERDRRINESRRRRPNSANSALRKPRLGSRKPVSQQNTNYYENEDMDFEGIVHDGDLYVNNKPYNSHPLHRYNVEKRREEAATKRRQYEKERDEHYLANFNSSPRQQSPRVATTVMLLSHEIISKRDQLQQPRPQQQKPSTAPQQSEGMDHLPRAISRDNNIQITQNLHSPSAGKKSLDVPVSTLTYEGPTATSSANQSKQLKNQKRILQIVENEMLNQKQQLHIVDKVSSDHEDETGLLPKDLTSKIQKQLNRYYELMNAASHPDPASLNELVSPQLSPEKNPERSEAISPEGIESPKVQWKGFIHQVPSSGVNLQEPPVAFGFENQVSTAKGETQPKITINGKIFRNIKRISFDAAYLESLNNADDAPNPSFRTSPGLRSSRNSPRLDEVDQDFMAVAGDAYLNDPTFRGEKKTSASSSAVVSTMPPRPSQEQRQIVDTGSKQQNEVVTLNKHVVSERIDKKYSQAFHFPSAKKPSVSSYLLDYPGYDQSDKDSEDGDKKYREYNLLGTYSPRNLKAKAEKEKKKKLKSLQTLKIETAKMKMAGRENVSGMALLASEIVETEFQLPPTSDKSDNIDNQTDFSGEITNLSNSQHHSSSFQNVKAPALKPVPPPLSVHFTVNSSSAASSNRISTSADPASDKDSAAGIASSKEPPDIPISVSSNRPRPYATPLSKVSIQGKNVKDEKGLLPIDRTREEEIVLSRPLSSAITTRPNTAVAHHRKLTSRS
jgi:hypothetical protein